jgi:hypothetical protein
MRVVEADDLLVASSPGSYWLIHPSRTQYFLRDFGSLLYCWAFRVSVCTVGCRGESEFAWLNHTESGLQDDAKVCAYESGMTVVPPTVREEEIHA